MTKVERSIATKTYEVYTDKYSCIVQAESISDALETFAAYYRREETDEVWSVEDVAIREEDRKSAAALRSVEAEPVDGKVSVDKIMEVVESGATHQVVNGEDWILVSRSDLRSRLSELGLK